MIQPNAIDVSHHAGQINWPQVKANHPELEAFFVRCSEGYFLRAFNDPLTHKDKEFDNNWLGVEGKNRGAYAFMRMDWDSPYYSIKTRPDTFKQIDNLMMWADPGTNDYIILDYEQHPDQLRYLSADTIRGRVIDGIVYALEQHPKLMIYTGGWWWNRYFPKGFTTSRVDLNAIPLWNSLYYNHLIENNNLPYAVSAGVVNGWGKVTWHQYGTIGRFAGIQTATDLNLYLGEGTVDDFFGVAPEPPDPPEPPVDEWTTEWESDDGTVRVQTR